MHTMYEVSKLFVNVSNIEQLEKNNLPGLSSVTLPLSITSVKLQNYRGKPRLVVNAAIPWITVVFTYRGSVPCKCCDFLLLYQEYRGGPLPRRRAVQTSRSRETVP